MKRGVNLGISVLRRGVDQALLGQGGSVAGTGAGQERGWGEGARGVEEGKGREF